MLASGPTPATQTVAVGNAASLTIANAVGLGPDHIPMAAKWDEPARQNQPRPWFSPMLSLADAGTYDVVVTGAGGSVTSPPPAAVLTVINPPVFVTGQWDF